MTTNELTLKEAICAMLDGEEIETHFKGGPWILCKFDGDAFVWGGYGPTIMSSWSNMEFRRKQERVVFYADDQLRNHVSKVFDSFDQRDKANFERHFCQAMEEAISKLTREEK